MEVDRVRHEVRGGILEVDPHEVADLDTDDRAGNGGRLRREAEGVDGLDVALGNRHRLLDHVEVDVVHLALEALGGGGVARDVRGGIRIRLDRRGRLPAVVHVRHVVGCGRRLAARRSAPANVQAVDQERSDQDQAEEDGGATPGQPGVPERSLH